MQQMNRDSGAPGRDGVDGRVAHDLLARIRAEYREMPGLCLTRSQAARLWGLSAERCAEVLEVLVVDGDLRCTRDGRYIATPRLLKVRRRDWVVGRNRLGAA
jgi:hypothetical protein